MVCLWAYGYDQIVKKLLKNQNHCHFKSPWTLEENRACSTKDLRGLNSIHNTVIWTALVLHVSERWMKLSVIWLVLCNLYPYDKGVWHESFCKKVSLKLKRWTIKDIIIGSGFYRSYWGVVWHFFILWRVRLFIIIKAQMI